MNLLKSWITDLHRVLEGEPLAVRDVRVGVFYTAAELASGDVGVAFTPRGLDDTVCCPKSAASAPPAGRMAGESAWSLAEYAFSQIALRRAVGVAVLNALSSMAIARHGVPGGKLLAGCDALKAGDIGRDDRVAMVGAFVPFIKSLRGNVADLAVIDKHREALKPDELPFWRSPNQAGEALKRADVVIISGSALVEGEIDGLLEASSRARTRILAGPTASPWPPPFFMHGVDVLGGIRVLDGPQLLRIVSEGGSGYIFEGAAEKDCIVRDHN
ncbi:MAG TPA: DUF364 domain-containing protein [Candidatus Binataceae bacterium]|nr:DUF364 domain-containing protein [Candidatus Binataceae bacterium]